MSFTLDLCVYFCRYFIYFVLQLNFLQFNENTKQIYKIQWLKCWFLDSQPWDYHNHKEYQSPKAIQLIYNQSCRRAIILLLVYR